MNTPRRPLRCLLVDDESLARRGLRHRLGQIGDLEIVAEAGNGREGWRWSASTRST